jgi:uncharacterized protein
MQAVYWAVTALMGVTCHCCCSATPAPRSPAPSSARSGPLRLHHQRDLTAMGKFLFMGLIGLILAVLLGPDRLRHPEDQGQYAEAWGTDTAEKVAIFGALSLYLDFVNLFQFLMMFLGQRRELLSISWRVAWSCLRVVEVGEGGSCAIDCTELLRVATCNPDRRANEACC